MITRPQPSARAPGSGDASPVPEERARSRSACASARQLLCHIAAATKVTSKSSTPMRSFTAGTLPQARSFFVACVEALKMRLKKPWSWEAE